MWGLVVALALGVLTVWASGARRAWEARRRRQHELEVHRERSREVYGCVRCGQELLPPGVTRHVCGTCKEL